MIEEIQTKIADKIDKNYFLYTEIFKDSYTIFRIQNKKQFIIDNPNSKISKIFEEVDKYEPFVDKVWLIKNLHNLGEIKIKDTNICLVSLMNEIKDEYPLIEEKIKKNNNEEKLMMHYIKIVDHYTQTNNKNV